ncbi:MAG: hypothetical protein RSB78_07415 [Oscillospiraceae bacterium]
MFRQFIPFAILYFIWDFISELLKVEGPFKLEHWIMVGMLVIFFVLLFVTGRDAIRDYKIKKIERDEEKKKAEQEAAEKRRAMFIPDNDEDSDDLTASDGLLSEPETVEAESVIVEQSDDNNA